jgi:hypothetical protein
MGCNPSESEANKLLNTDISKYKIANIYFLLILNYKLNL